MQAYILSIAGVVLISTVISIIVPTGKMGKFIKGMTKLFILVVLIAPFVSWAGGDKYIFTTSELGRDTEYLEYCAVLLSEEDERKITAWLKEGYGVVAEVSVLRNFDGFTHEKIKVSISDFGINEPHTHIDIVADIRARLEHDYGCSAEVS